MLYRIDPEFHDRCKELGKSIIIGGENYGQGSSREHAVPSRRCTWASKRSLPNRWRVSTKTTSSTTAWCR
ncbi:hypothetical protein AB7B97_24400 [Klebsiella pneumoniae]